MAHYTPPKDNALGWTPAVQSIVSAGGEARNER
jgi:hypothetical protein